MILKLYVARDVEQQKKIVELLTYSKNDILTSSSKKMLIFGKKLMSSQFEFKLLDIFTTLTKH